jgi:hypothetical protein
MYSILCRLNLDHTVTFCRFRFNMIHLSASESLKRFLLLSFFFFLDYETIGTAATPGLLCQPRVIMKMIVESMVECR